MNLDDVTVVVVPRERFSFAKESLASIYANTPGLAHLVYVDGNSPEPLRRYLETRVAADGFTYVRCDRYLVPNEARNIGAARARTKYVVFVDNDVLVGAAWLEHLVACAEETGAAIVGPLYLIDVGGNLTIHLAGGEAHIEESDGSRVYVEKHALGGTPFSHASPPALERTPTELAEFHTMLVRIDAFAQTGVLDERIRSVNEHLDFCMIARSFGKTVYMEPKSIVTYVTPVRLARSDLPYFMLRWSEGWNHASLARFNAKWNLDASHRRNRQIVKFARHHRRSGLHLDRSRPVRTWHHWLRRRTVAVAETCFNVAYMRLRGN